MTQVIPDREIIDATQNAVLSAASDMAEVFGRTAQELENAEPFYMSAEFWVGLTFVLTIVCLLKPVGRIILQKLQQRGKDIADRIKEAADLKEEAQKLLADYERKFRGAEKEAADILARAERETDMVKKETLAKLEVEMAAREKEAQSRLKATEVSEANEIAQKTTDLTMATVRKIWAESFDNKAQGELIDASIETLQKLV